MSGAVGGRAQLFAALLRRPLLWGEALRLGRTVARRRWWLRPPFLPVPDPDYLAFRLLTHTGSTSHEPGADELVAYLQWCRRMRRHRG